MIDHLAVSEEEDCWVAPIPRSYGTFFDRPLSLHISTYVQDPSYIDDPSPPPTPVELALAEQILDHLPELLEEAQRQFLHYNTEMTDDPEAVQHVVKPSVYMSREFGANAGRWTLTVERDDIPIGYMIEFDGLRHVETWAAS